MLRGVQSEAPTATRGRAPADQAALGYGSGCDLARRGTARRRSLAAARACPLRLASGALLGWDVRWPWLLLLAGCLPELEDEAVVVQGKYVTVHAPATVP